MQWRVVYVVEFETWLDAQVEGLQDEALARIGLLGTVGPTLGRPYVDTLKGSKIANLKELRFDYERAPIRILFVFDPQKQAVMLLGGDKKGDKRWYESNVPIAEKRYEEHLERQRKGDDGRKRRGQERNKPK